MINLRLRIILPKWIESTTPGLPSSSTYTSYCLLESRRDHKSEAGRLAKKLQIMLKDGDLVKPGEAYIVEGKQDGHSQV